MILAVFSVLALAPALFVGPLETAVTATGPRLAPPSAAYPFGTDELGRSMLNLTVHATRISMVIGLLATVVTVVVGAVLGIVSGYVGGRIDASTMRVADFFLVLPTFVLAIILTAIIRDVIGTGSKEFFGIRLEPDRDRRRHRPHELVIDRADHPGADAVAARARVRRPGAASSAPRGRTSCAGTSCRT